MVNVISMDVGMRTKDRVQLSQQLQQQAWAQACDNHHIDYGNGCHLLLSVKKLEQTPCHHDHLDGAAFFLEEH